MQGNSASQLLFKSWQPVGLESNL